MTQVGMKIRFTCDLLASESKAARELDSSPRFLYINPSIWDAFTEETPYAPYYSKGRMTFYSAKVVLDPNEQRWRFTNEAAN